MQCYFHITTHISRVELTPAWARFANDFLPAPLLMSLEMLAFFELCRAVVASKWSQVLVNGGDMSAMFRKKTKKDPVGISVFIAITY